MYLNLSILVCLSLSLPQVNNVLEEHKKYAGFNMDVDGSVWEAIHDEGEMKVYRREMEEDGMIVDPLKAVHSVQVSSTTSLSHLSIHTQLLDSH